MMPLALGLAESGGNGGGSRAGIVAGTALRLAKNPLIISICAGTAFSLLGVPLSGPFGKTLDLLAAASAPVALFTIGGTLAGLPVRGMLGDAGQIAFTKLIVHPAAVFVIFAGMPMAAIYPLLAQPYGRAEQSAAALALATVASFFTISVLLLIV